MKSVQLDIKLNQNQNRAETSPTVCLFIVNLKNWNVSRCWKTHQFYYKWFKNKVHFLFGCFIASDPLNHLRHDSFLCCRKTVITVVILVSCDITAARPIKPSVLMVTWTDGELLSRQQLYSRNSSQIEGNVSAPRFCWVQPMIRSPPSELPSAELWVGVGQDTGQQGRGRMMVGGLASVQVQVQCGRGRRVQVVWGQEHPASFSQELQTHSWLTLPLGPDRSTQHSLCRHPHVQWQQQQ